MGSQVATRGCGAWPWLGVRGLSNSASLVLLPEIAEDWAWWSPQLFLGLCRGCFAGYGSKAQTALLHWTFSSYRTGPTKCFKATFFDDCWCTYKLGYLHAVAVRVFSFSKLLCRHFTMGLSTLQHTALAQDGLWLNRSRWRRASPFHSLSCGRLRVGNSCAVNGLSNVFEV